MEQLVAIELVCPQRQGAKVEYNSLSSAETDSGKVHTIISDSDIGEGSSKLLVVSPEGDFSFVKID